MLINYCKIAFRSIWRSKVFSAINIFGLALGLATCLLIALFVKDELSYDKYHVNADRIYRINAKFRIDGNELNEKLSPAPMGPALVNEYPQVESFLRIADWGSMLVKRNGNTISEPNGCFADSSLFRVFTLTTLAGNPATALKEPNTMVITDRMAAKYFAGVPVYAVPGKRLTVDKTNYTVTAVIREMPAQSHIHLSLIAAMSGKAESRTNNWLDNGFDTYVLMRKGSSQKDLDKAVNALIKKYAEPQFVEGMGSSFADLTRKGDYYNYTSVAIADIHLHSPIAREAEPGGNAQYVYIFIVIAIFILLIACVNFMNLATARSAGRSKEVGIRKVLGSRRISLIYQFLTESMIMVFISLCVSVVLVILVLPYFNQLSGKEISARVFLGIRLWGVLLVCMLVVGLLAGSYPAFFLSAFKPARVLKGKLATGLKGGWLRNGLVVFQFTTAIVLIIGTLVIYSQLDYIRNRNLGYRREQVLVLENTGPLGNHAKSFKDRALKIPGIESATMADVLPTANETHADVFFREPIATPGKTMALESWYVDADYLHVMGMQMASGRNFSPQLPTDSVAVLINQTTAGILGYRDPVGKNVYQKDEKGKIIAHPIIGVVKDFNAGSLRNKIPPIVFALSDERTHMAFRINAKNTAGIITQLEQTYHGTEKMAGQPFVFIFMDEAFDHLYQSEERTGRIFISFAIFAIVIASLGLFGLVTYAAEQRTKEISIRKVLGAGMRHIVGLLSGNFLRLVALSALIAFPVAWWAMNKWLQDFAYRTTIQWWVFAFAGIAALCITFLTIAFRCIKAATANPADSLKTE